MTTELISERTGDIVDKDASSIESALDNPVSKEQETEDSEVVHSPRSLKREYKATNKQFDGLVGEIAATGFKVAYLDEAANRYQARVGALNQHEFNDRHPIETAKREIVGSMLADYIDNYAKNNHLSEEDKEEYCSDLINTFISYGDLSADERAEANGLVQRSAELENELGEKKESPVSKRRILKLGRSALAAVANGTRRVGRRIYEEGGALISGVYAANMLQSNEADSTIHEEKQPEDSTLVAEEGEFLEEYEERHGIARSDEENSEEKEIQEPVNKRSSYNRMVFAMTPGGIVRSFGTGAEKLGNKKRAKIALGVVAVGGLVAATYFLTKSGGGNHLDITALSDLNDKLSDAQDKITRLEGKVDAKQDRINDLKDAIADRKGGNGGNGGSGGSEINALSFADGSGGEELMRNNGIDTSVWYAHEDEFLKQFPDLSYRMSDGHVGLIDQSTSAGTSKMPKAAQEWWEARR